MPHTESRIAKQSSFTASQGGWSERARFFAVLSAVTASFAFAWVTVASGRLGSFFGQSDAGWYVALARGNTQVSEPFAARQLGPLAVRGIAALLHTSIEHAFLIQGVLCMLLTLLFVFDTLSRTAAPRWFLLAAITVPFWPQLLSALVLPDLWYAAMLCVLLYLVARGQILWAAVMMFPLLLSRESTSLTMICFLIACWQPLRWRGRILTLASTLAGVAIVHRLTQHSHGNVEHLSGPVYLLSKGPWNLLRLLGFRPWSNLYPFLCRTPDWWMALHIGRLQTIGNCGFSPLTPELALLAAGTTFGLLPLLTAVLWWRTRKLHNENLLLRFCLLYGGLCFVLAPLLGTGFSRLFGYAWPLFLVGLPLLLERFALLHRKDRTAAAIFLALHVTLCALIFVQNLQIELLAMLTIYVSAFFLLRGWFRAQKAANAEV